MARNDAPGSPTDTLTINLPRRLSETTGRQQYRRSLSQRACVMQMLRDFFADKSGATAIEYALIAGGISIAIVAAVGTLGTTLNATFTSVSTALK